MLAIGADCVYLLATNVLPQLDQTGLMLQRQSTSASLIDVLDRVLDKGIVIDAWVALSVMGINLVAIEARMVVASIETYIRNGDNVTRILQSPRTRPT